MPEALASEPAQRTMQLAPLIADDVRTEVAVRPRSIAFVADALGQIQDDGHRQDVVFARKRDERLARLGLDVGRVDDGELPTRQPSRRHEVQGGKGVVGRRLVVLVVRHERAEAIRRHHLGRLEVLAGERRLAAPGRADQDDQRQLGNREHRVAGHRVIGAETPPSASEDRPSLSSSPTGRNVTA